MSTRFISRSMVVVYVLRWKISREFAHPAWSVPLDSPFFRQWDGEYAEKVPPFDTDANADYEVLKFVRKKWDRDRLVAFRDKLRELHDARDDPEYRINGFVVLRAGRYEIGDYSKAALAVIDSERKDRE